MKLLITGATGFIGQHLVDHLSHSNHSLRLLSRKEFPAFWCSLANVELVKGDLTDRSSLRDALTGIDVVINLAAEIQCPSKFHAVNVLGSKNVIELVGDIGTKKVVHLSSVGVVGEQYSLGPHSVDETHTCSPKNEYERTKLESEMHFLNASDSMGFELAVLRPTNVYGDRHPRNALLNYFHRLSRNAPVFCSRNGLVNYLYVRDLVEAICYFIENESTEKIYNVGHAETFTAFHACAKDAMGSQSRPYILPSMLFRIASGLNAIVPKRVSAQLRGVSNRITYVDDRINSRFKYRFGLEDGIQNTVAYYESQGLLERQK